MNKEQAESLVDNLISAAYDSGYYQGIRKKDAYIEAVDRRNRMRLKLLRRLQPVIEDGQAKKCHCPKFSDGTKIFPQRICDGCKPPAA